MKTTTCVVEELTLVHGVTGMLAADHESLPVGTLVRNMVEDSREESDFTGEVIVRVSFDASTDGGESWYTYRALVYENDYLASLFEVDFTR